MTAGAYKMIQMAIIGEARMRELTEAGALDGDPLLSTVLLFALFGFFAKFWTHGGQTLGMQVWGVRVQNADGSAISLWQALLRFVVSIASWLCLGLGFFWVLIDKRKRAGMTSIRRASWCGCRSRRNEHRLTPMKKPTLRSAFLCSSGHQPARRNNHTPAKAQMPAGITTASSGGKPNTWLEGPNKS